jgi:exopolysaccharide biosynthesis protein
MHVKLLRYVMSDAEINNLLVNSHGKDNNDNQKDGFKFKNNHSDLIKLTQINSYRFHGYLMEISDPTRLKVGVADTLGDKGQTTSQIASQNDAIAAVNAGGFKDPNGTGNGREPDGVIIKDGYFLHGENLPGTVPLIDIQLAELLP